MRVLLAPAAFLILAAAQAAPQSLQGRWKSPGGNSIIDIGPCGAALCGTVAWASQQAKQASAKKGTTQLIGAQLLTGLTQRGDGRWQGRLFIPDQNMRVTAKLELVGANQLKVTGCALGKSLCRSDLWTRFDGPLPASG